MSHSTKARFLHVANGTCTTAIIEASGIPGAASIWADPLYEGPVPGGLGDEELLEVRARHLAGPTASSYVGAVNDLRGWRRTIEAHDAYDELVLWFEHDLFDQLNLIRLLTWLRRRLPGRKVVSLVCIGSFPGHPRFKGLGELAPDELASLLDTRQPVSEAQYMQAEEAWGPSGARLQKHWTACGTRKRRRCRTSRPLSRAFFRSIRRRPMDCHEASAGSCALPIATRSIWRSGSGIPPDA